LYLVRAPTQVLRMLDEAAMELVVSMFTDYRCIRPEIHVRINDLPYIDRLRDIRQTQRNSLIRVAGRVTEISGISTMIKIFEYSCNKCMADLGPFYQDPHKPLKLNKCSNCGSSGPFKLLEQKTTFRNYQKVTIQEDPGSVSAARVPRKMSVILLDDLVNSTVPGDSIVIDKMCI